MIENKKRTIDDLTVCRVRELLDYNMDTGVFRWRVFVGSKATAGSEAGRVDGHGYIRLSVDKVKDISAHRLAWFYVYGKWPDMHIDHINGVKTDNRISNLREADRSINMQNQRKANRDNPTGMLGVSWREKYKHFRAVISIGKKQKHIGSFRTAEEAHAAYLAVKREIHKGCSL
jgi:hypothetical protein